MEILTFGKILFAATILNACNPSAEKGKESNNAVNTAVELNLSGREEISLPAELDEISGHTFIKGNDDLLYCVQDEKGIIYVYNLKTKSIVEQIDFAEDGDYEGIVTDGDYFYVLNSKGTIFSVPVKSENRTGQVKIYKDLLGKGEYESLGIDEKSKELVVLCKSCKQDRKIRQSTSYLLTYNEKGEVILKNSFVIDLNSLVAIDSKFPKAFNPSEVTFKSSTNEWYILSSIDKVIVVTDQSFQPKSIIPFSRKDYEQPEGMAFDSQNNLYISSERGEESSGMLYKIVK